MATTLVPIYFVDAFTTNGNSPFTGNPAAICFLDYDDEISDALKSKIASEINLSETVFVSLGWTNGEKLTTAEGSQLHRRTIRWFTPTNEVELCGHGTLAATKALVEAQLTDLYLDPKVKTIPISFESKLRGKLGAALSKDTGRLTLNFPSQPTHELNKKEHSSWIDDMIAITLGDDVPPSFVCDVQYSPGLKILLLRLSNDTGIMSPADLLSKVSPDFKKLKEINTGDFARNVIVTVKGEARPTTEGGSEEASKEVPHFYSRFFAPKDGVNEDPVCGSAHTVLTPYWTHELTKSLKGESVVGTLLGRQHSKRGGNLYCTLVGDRVNVSGDARVIIKGHIFV